MGGIRVAVVTDGTLDSGYTAVVDQLNDDTFYDFDAVLVNPTDIDTVAELNTYRAVVIGDSGNGGYLSFEAYSPAEVAASLEGTLASNMSIAFNSPQKGLLKVVVYGAFPASGDGVYVNLRFRVIGTAGSATPLTIKGFRFNEGTDDVFATDTRMTLP